MAQRSSVWTTIWQDKFNGSVGRGVNTAHWKYDTGYGIFGNGAIETTTDSPGNVSLDGRGGLDITAVGSGQSWTSGRIQTLRTFGTPAGGEMKVTASIKQPSPAGGLGYWPAFWLLGSGSWPQHGEIDILEDVNALSQHSGAFHCGNLTSRNADGTFGPCHEHTGLSSGMLPCPACQTGYHTYSVVVDRRDQADEHIYWYLDGKKFFTLSERQVGVRAWTEAADSHFSIILDVAMGGSFPDGRCDCATPTVQTTSGGTMSVRGVTVAVRR